MKRSIETLGVLFVFAFFCPFSAEAVTPDNGYGISDGDLLGEITRTEFNHTFKNQGLERGPFELMRMEGFHRPEDTPVENRWELGDNSHSVPEPCTMLLLALGGPLLLSRRKR